ncbi:MAG: hypothetical protein ABIC04_07905 [Nanoarchaeota archaeon]
MELNKKKLDKFAEKIIKPFEQSLKISLELEKKTNKELAYLLMVTIDSEVDMFGPHEALLSEVIKRLEANEI